MVLPSLFTAGMSLVDTADGVLMIGAYGWAFAKAIRKLYYNLTSIFVSVVVALIVGGVEAIGLLKDQLNLIGGVWDFIGSLNDNFSILGFVIIGVFFFSWIGSMIVYRVESFDVWNRRPPLPIDALSWNRITLYTFYTRRFPASDMIRCVQINTLSEQSHVRGS